MVRHPCFKGGKCCNMLYCIIQKERSYEDERARMQEEMEKQMAEQLQQMKTTYTQQLEEQKLNYESRLQKIQNER